ncbi:hypothetical protein QTG54_011287 [Skeletonema marinoi]|uniref:HMG box domain-containing protein n=1 Tax=Skeletonema marinoi TaxID=267567 RepID=A0AAD8Y1W2_9STRA|nr:hypothetical protein QTG54_011287 [Skeletonema marinoi]
MEKPKRPLSSFNLFYRYKRSLLTGQDISEEAVKNILTCPAGLEDGLLPSTSRHQQQQQQSKRTSKNIKPSLKTNELRRTKIRTALDGKILPSSDTKKRRHRKAANGPSISFVEMGRLMTESWKSVDPYARQVFDDLAGEGREYYRDALEKYTEVGVTEEHDCGGPLRSSSKPKKNPSSKLSSQKNEKKVSVHKVSRCVKKTPIKSMKGMMFTRSKEPSSMNSGFGDSNNGMGDEALSRRRHVSINPEDIARPLPQQTGGFAPVPEQTYGAITESMQLFPPTSSQIGNQQVPQPRHRPRQMYHQQQYYQYHQRQQQRHTHDAHIPPHLAGGGGRSGDVAIGEHAGVDFLDDYAAYPIFQHDRGGELNLNNEDDIRTFFDK